MGPECSDALGGRDEKAPPADRRLSERPLPNTALTARLFLIGYWDSISFGGALNSRVAERAKKTLSKFARLVLLSLFVTLPVCAQKHSLDVSQYLHSTWTAQQGYFRGIGISDNGIAQTADGYLWFLSSTGVIRFDGVRFVEWKPPHGESFPSSPPSQLLASRDGSLWIGGAGVAQLSANGTWHRYHELDALHRVRLAEDKDGVIWVGAESSATPNSFLLFHIEHGVVGAYKLPEFLRLALFPLFADREGRLWADSGRGIWRILPGPPTLVLKKQIVTPVFSEDSAGGLLYAEDGRVRKLWTEGTSADYLGKLQVAPLNVRAMMRDKDGGLWIGTFGQGIVHLHEGRIDHFTSLDGLSSDTVESIFQDREGNMWSTSPDSIDEFSKPAVSRLTRKQGLSGDAVFSVLVDRRERTWIGTSDGFNELVSDDVIRPDNQLHNDNGLALVETHAGHLLMTTKGRDEAMAQKQKHAASGIGGGSWLEGYGNVFSFAEDNDGTLWAVSQELGLLHLRENGSLIEAINDPKWGDFPVSVAFDPKRDGIWFSTHNGKVFFLKGGKILERYGQTDGFGSGTVRILQVDDDGGVWIAARAGLAHLMDHKVFILGPKNGLPCGNVHWMRHDQNRHVWIYTECGLISFADRDLSAWIAQPSHHVSITAYLDNTEGVENTAIGGWYTPESAMTVDGRILFAMRTGLGLLDPRQLNQNALPPPVHIEEITADDRAIESGGRPSLPANTGVIHIAYTALSFVAPRKVRFRYRLQGYDKAWSSPVSLREVTYTNLPPGNYRFQVIACNNNGIWNDKGATLSFFVAPSWYQTLWFRFLAFFTVLSLLTAFYLTRVSRVEREMNLRFEERMTERMRIARELHDTLLQSLQGLVLSFSSFSARVTATTDVQEKMERSLERAEQLVIAGRERIRDLRGEQSKAVDLTAALSAAVNETLGDLGPNFNVKVEGVPRSLHEVVQDETVWIAREALANARQHSGGDTVQLLVTFQEDEFRLSVEDNGRGFSSNVSVDGHFGLIGMRERAEAIGGRLSVQSSSARGTIVGLAVPGRIAYNEERSWFRSLLLPLIGRARKIRERG